jgi:hypothetical protein
MFLVADPPATSMFVVTEPPAMPLLPICHSPVAATLAPEENWIWQQ